MTQLIKSGLVAAVVALLTVPTGAFAQKEKEKEKVKEKVKDDDGMQQIIVTRKGDPNGKTIIEVDGDKVKVNGKEVDKNDKDNDVTVRVSKFKTYKNVTGVYAPGASTWTYNGGNGRTSFFAVDSNRAMLGVVTDADDHGAKITTVNKESAADKAGLKVGDVITKVDGKKVEDAEDVSEVVRGHKPGDKVSITYLREGKEQKATAELGRWQGIRMSTAGIPRVRGSQGGVTIDGLNDIIAPAMPNELFKGNNFSFDFSNRPKLGLSVQDTEDGKGVKVLEADKEGTGAKAGIQKDDVILKIDDQDVNSADEIARLMREKRNNPNVKFNILRNGKPQTVEVKIPRKLKTADL